MNQLDTSVDALDQLLSMPMPSKKIEEQKQKLRRILTYLAVVLGLHAVFFIAVALKNPPLSGKVLLIEIMVFTSIFCLTIAYYANQIMDILRQLEALADLARDQAFVELGTVREQMETLRHRLRHDEQALHTSTVLPDLLKSIGPLAMLLLQKETSAVRWGMVGWKVAQNAMAFFKERSQKPAS